ncbi:MAG: Mur ligase domain-containing protein, partial [Bacteroidota bacterium]
MHSIETIYRAFLESSGICTDTRKLLPGSLFVALAGENFDGNDYAEKALELGAAYALVSRPAFEGRDRCLVVDDTLKVLQNLARHHRRHF